METRLLIAYTLIALLVLFLAFLVWLNVTRTDRELRRQTAARERRRQAALPTGHADAA